MVPVFISFRKRCPCRAKGLQVKYAFPEKDKWEFVFHSNTSHWGDGRENYNPGEDVLRIDLKPEEMSDIRENFLITFDNIDHNGMDMILEWEYTRLRIPIGVDTEAMMQLEIEKQIETNPTAQTYYEAARYLQEQGLDTLKALDYVNKALKLGGDTYYFHRIKSLLEASLGNYKAAIEAATTSMEIANTLGKDEFVRMNQRNINKWKTLLPANELKVKE